MFKDKSEILAHISDKDDKMLVSSIYGKLYQSTEKSYPCYSDFLDARQIILVKNLFGFLKDTLVFFGGIENSERKIVAIDCGYRDETPIRIVRIKRHEGITHRDVLGSIMSLGIKRQKIGDIVFDDFIYIAVKEEISGYILENFTKIRHYDIKPEIHDGIKIKRNQEFLDISLTVASLRADAVISAIIHLAREKSKELILSGKVNLNHFELSDNKKTLNEGDIISIKGTGRFILSQINGTTKKDRIRIAVNKYK